MCVTMYEISCWTIEAVLSWDAAGSGGGRVPGGSPPSWGVLLLLVNVGKCFSVPARVNAHRRRRAEGGGEGRS